MLRKAHCQISVSSPQFDQYYQLKHLFDFWFFVIWLKYRPIALFHRLPGLQLPELSTHLSQPSLQQQQSPIVWTTVQQTKVQIKLRKQ